MNRKSLIVNRFFLLFAVCCILSTAYCSEVDIKVEKGESVTQITEKLHKEGIIKHPFWFKAWAKITGNERKIKAGYYQFERPSSIRKTLRKLVNGESIEFSVTIPEGATLKEIAELFSRQCGVEKEEFLQLARDSVYVRSFGIQASSLEGYLFPDTYLVSYEVKPREIIQRMVDRFFQIFNQEFKERAEKIGLSIEKAVILASLVEKEAIYTEEEPVISGVYHNRLNAKSLLQCDATIQYILPERKSRLTYRDLKVDSRYNTYIYKGLPPGPIGSPGKSSIRAALWPEDTRYWYFVARGDGTHIFSRTLREHNRAKLKVKSEKLKVD